MIGWALALSALVASGHSKAIITNNCRKEIYIWSVPEKADLANNLSISPGKRYEEPWRSGTSIHPGIAIKISTEHDGIYTGKSEINFQYAVDAADSTKIWINLATVRGKDLDNATLNTCSGAFKSPSVSTEQCSSADDIELVVCGSERTVPSQDSTPIRVISDCIGLLAERDDPIYPRMCSGRVVGPKRMPMLPDEQEDEWLAEHVDKVPLKTVMRREAAKHVASQDAEAHNAPRAQNTTTSAPGKATEKSTSPGPMCNLLHEAWPDAQCDEKIAQHNAKLFYQDHCGEKTKHMFPGASCEAIRHQMKQIYPGVEDHRFCVSLHLARLRRFWGSKDNVLHVLNNEGHITEPFLPGISWTLDDEVCQNPNKKIRPTVKGGRRCVEPFCEKGISGLGGHCSEVEDQLERLSEIAGFDIDWTTDDDACVTKRAVAEKRDSALASRQDVNVSVGTDHRWNDIRKVCITTATEKLGKYWGANETEEWIPQIFSRVIWTENLDDCSPQAITESRAYHHKLIDKKQAKVKKCVEHCQGKTCKRVKKELNKLSKDVGENWSWTDDEMACTRNTAFGPGGPKSSRCVMGEDAIDRLRTYWSDYSDVMDEVFPKIDWWSNSECDFSYDMAAKNWFNDHRETGKRMRRCVNPYCKPFNADCSDVENQLEKVSKNLSQNVDWTTDDDACLKHAVRHLDHSGSGWDVSASESASDESVRVQLPGLCKGLFGSAIVDQLGEYWGPGVEAVMDYIFPDLSEIDYLRPCRQGVDSVVTGQTWFQDHPVKRGQRCVTPYCKPINADCNGVEAALEKLFENIGQATDWTTNDDVCLKDAVNPVNHALVNPDEYLASDHCLLAWCSLWHISEQECGDYPELFAKTVFEQSGVRVKLQIDGPACQGPRANEIPQFPPAVQTKRDSHKVCRRDLCRRSGHSDHDCQKVEDHVRSFLNETMQIDVDFADSQNICEPALAQESFEEPTTYASNASTAH